MSVKMTMLASGFIGALVMSASQANATQTQLTNTFDRNEATFFTTIEVNRTESTPLVDRIERLSAVLKGIPYVDGALGEGKNGQFDQDPLYRFDEFDCTTYIETVLAGALSKNPNDFLPNLTHIRYKNGDVSFVNRNHFPSADWFPNNRTILTDITTNVGGADTKQASAVIDKKAWYQHMTMDRLQSITASDSEKQMLLKTLQHAGDGFTPYTATLDYVPLTALFIPTNNATDPVIGSKVNLALLNKIPTGSLISMVRPNWNLKKRIGTNMNVSHQSFLIRKDGILYLRHASQIEKKVIDVNFVQYLFQYRHNSTLKGFNVQVAKSSF